MGQPRVKICGLTNLADVQVAIEAGADLVGFIFAASPRQVTRHQVSAICEQLPADINKVGIFANQSLAEIKEVITNCELDYLQLHGNESPDFCQQFQLPVIKAFRIEDRSSLEQLAQYQVDKYLLDTYVPNQLGGTGQTFNWQLAKEAQQSREIILAGGLDPSNVAQAVKTVDPWAVDVSSGVETKPGNKDQKQIKRLVKRVKGN